MPPDLKRPISRRDLLNLGACVVGGSVLAACGVVGNRYRRIERQATESSLGVQEVTIASADLPQPGDAVFTDFGDHPVVILRRPGGELLCLDAKCTHAGCLVEFHKDADRLVCPCHHGEFDADSGERLAGPPQHPLPKFKIAASGEKAVISRS